jgi:hypothetical protein
MSPLPSPFSRRPNRRVPALSLLHDPRVQSIIALANIQRLRERGSAPKAEGSASGHKHHISNSKQNRLSETLNLDVNNTIHDLQSSVAGQVPGDGRGVRRGLGEGEGTLSEVTSGLDGGDEGLCDDVAALGVSREILRAIVLGNEERSRVIFRQLVVAVVPHRGRFGGAVDVESTSVGRGRRRSLGW